MSSLPINIPGSQHTSDRSSEETEDLPPGSPVLRDDTAAALRDFLQSREQINLESEGNPFKENWALSQFWYTHETAVTIARVVADYVGTLGRIACVACPSLFHELSKSYPQVRCDLFEFDTRFQGLGNFHFYDYNSPCGIDGTLLRAFDLVIADPPYLSKDCLEKVAITIKALAQNPSTPSAILLTGSTMRDTAEECLGVRPVGFRPQHKSKLGNEFMLYTSIDAVAEALGGYDM
eukprot:jgi/Botrbrau1/5886/Bobra.0366s0064.1